MNKEEANIVTIEELIDKVKEYNPSCNEELILKAYNKAAKAHEGQKRLSGEDYILHPLNVAKILTTLEMDDEAICAALMHDVVEDTSVTYEEMKEEFGETIANIVDGVTKLGRVPYETKEEEMAENLRKMLLSMAKDIRVIIIKLADRLHNMRTLKYKPSDRRVAIAKETQQVFAPIANRLRNFLYKMGTRRFVPYVYKSGRIS